MHTAQPLIRTMAIAGIALLALTACSAKGATATTSSEPDAVKTGAGIVGDTISLGVVSDYSGPFSPLATAALGGIQTFWDQQNSDGGVCGTYQVELVVRDHASNAQQSAAMYQEIGQDVLAYQDYSGAAQIGAILPDLEADGRLMLANSATQQLIDSPLIMIPAAFIGTDAQISLSWLLDSGTLEKGDTFAAIYQETDFGEQANEGAVEFADEHGLTALSYQVKPTDTDMTAAVTDAIANGAQVIVAGVAPGQTASIATVLQSAGSDIPIAGVYSSFVPALLDTPAAGYLTEHMTLTSYIATFEAGPGAELYATLSAEEEAPVTANAVQGYLSATLMSSILEAACAAGDLTPEGVAAQRFELGPTDFDGHKVTFDYSSVGESPTNEAFIVHPDAAVDGGLSTISDGPFTLSK